ncbi:MAG: DUF3078 domain-containing protein [Bacteroidaceae bacterium]|nr:DUF3078 domain-containing protein [Bacteroidaceae bacterium]
MQHTRICILTFLTLIICGNLFAHNHTTFDNNTEQQNDTLQMSAYDTAYSDSIVSLYTNQLATLKKKYSKWKYLGNDTLANPYYYRLFFLSRLSDSIFSQSIGSLKSKSNSAVIQKYQYMNRLLTQSYAENPNWISNIQDVKNVELPPTQTANLEIKPQPEAKKKEEAKPEPVDEFDQAWSLVVKKPNFWKIKSNFSLQFMQSYASSNWHQGATNYRNFLATCNIEANYDNKRGFKVDNRLEMRLGFQNSHNDNEHSLKTHSDQIRLTNNFGLKAFKNWYYTISLQSWTQFYKGYRANDERVYSDFMSPFESVLSVGMDYALRVKNFEFTAKLAPFAGKLKYCDRRNLVNNFGLRDKHSRFEFGSNITSNFKWTICKNIQWNGRIYYFTDYKKAQIEWENTINLKINKYLSTKLYLYPRFDDSVVKKPGKNYFQLKEELSLGIDISL